MLRRRGVAKIAATVAVAIAAAGCTLPTDSADPASAPDSDRSDIPTQHTVAPLAGAGEVSPTTGFTPPDTTAEWTPASRTSGPLPDDIADRMSLAQRAAAARGADVSIALLDRVTGDRLGAGSDTVVETASVAKLFIADEVLHESPAPTDDELDLIGRMLEDSDDDAANALWSEYGGSAVVESVAARYHLTTTGEPWDGNWWNTTTTADDLVDYYAGLLDGTGGLAEDASARILMHLRASAPTAADGYDQRFGAPDALGAAGTLAVKQGWMCCVADQWVHLSTAVVGSDARYVLVVASHETVDYEDDPDAQEYPSLPDTSIDAAVDDPSATHARQTVTEVIRNLFPDGRIG